MLVPTAFQVPAIAIDNSPTSGIGSVSPNSVSPTGSVTSPAWAFFDDLEDHEPDFADELDDGLGDEDEALAMALAPGVRMSRAMSIGPDEDDRLALHMLDESEKRDRKSRKRISRKDSMKRLTKLKVYGISDLHADFEENLAWLRELPETEYKNDVLCVAGDVSEHMEILEIVWKILVPRFHRVFFVVGNHDLWTSLEHKVIPRN